MKAVFLSPVPAPYQIAFAGALQKHLTIEFWFMTTIRESTRPSYWETNLPPFCKILPTYFRKKQLFYCPSLAKHLSSFQPDFVILHGKWNNLSWYIAYQWALKNHKKVIMGPLENPTKQNWLKETLRKILYRKIDAFLCVGYRSLDYYSTIKEKQKTYLLSYAADLEREFDHPLRPFHKEITFLHSGSINSRFRVLNLLKTFEKLARHYQEIRLILSGDGPLKEECMKMIKDSTLLSSQVSWLYVNSWADISMIYQNADVLISYPSYAGWGLTIPEAMASGMGIISGNGVESGRELIIEGYNGYLVRDDKELEQAMISYILEPKKVQTHGEINKVIARKEGVFEKAKSLNQILVSLSGQDVTSC